MPKYKKYSSKGSEPTTLINFNMVCYGLSQNTQKHQLYSYRDAIMGKPYNELCDNIASKLIYEPYAIYRFDRIVFKNGRMDIPNTPVPRYLKLTRMCLDSELVQTFIEHVDITKLDIFRESVNRNKLHKFSIAIMPLVTQCRKKCQL